MLAGLPDDYQVVFDGLAARVLLGSTFVNAEERLYALELRFDEPLLEVARRIKQLHQQMLGPLQLGKTPTSYEK